MIKIDADSLKVVVFKAGIFCRPHTLSFRDESGLYYYAYMIEHEYIHKWCRVVILQYPQDNPVEPTVVCDRVTSDSKPDSDKLKQYVLAWANDNPPTSDILETFTKFISEVYT